MSTEDLPSQDTPLSIGERLCLARQQQGLSQKAVAERLCLTLSTVRNIEENRTDHLGETFFRGYIRSYARLVHIPEDDLLPDSGKQSPIKRSKYSTTRNFPSLKRRKKHDGCLMFLTLLIIIVLLALTGAWWWQNHKAQQEKISPMKIQPATPHATVIPLQPSAPRPSVQASPVQQAPVQLSPAPQSSVQPLSVQPLPAQQPSSQQSSSPATIGQHTSQPVTADVSAHADNEAASQLANQQHTSPATAPSNTNSSAASANKISMNFSAECWIDISDASGKKLFSGLKYRGDKLELNGQAPYRLIIGAPHAVRIYYQGKSVDLSHFAGNKVARLTLNASS